MALRKRIHRVELTDEIGTKEMIAVVKQGNAKILCKDKAGDWTFDIHEIDDYIKFLQAVREQVRDSEAVQLGLPTD